MPFALFSSSRGTGRSCVLRSLGVLLVVICLFAPTSAFAGDREVITRVRPTMPEIAKRLKITGTVLLNVTVSPSGHVKSVSTIMGNSMLDEAAKEAVSKWKFAPAESETIEEIEVDFSR